MLDALLEGLARFLGGFLIDFLYYKVLHAIGWTMLRALTFGRYPLPPPARHNEELVALFPVLVLFVALTLAFS